MMAGQADLLDLLAELEPMPVLEVHSCVHCGETYWESTGNPLWTLDLMDHEHREVEPSVCGRMAEVRDMHELYSTGRKVPEPHWSKADLRNWIAELAAHRGRKWKIYNERST